MSAEIMEQNWDLDDAELTRRAQAASRLAIEKLTGIHGLEQMDLNRTC